VVAHLVAESPGVLLLVLPAVHPKLLGKRPNRGDGLEAYARLDPMPEQVDYNTQCTSVAKAAARLARLVRNT
jgi:hypothetical protein